MVVKNKWVGYLDRTYQQIKSSVLSKLSIYLPEMTDHTESNPFIIEVDVWAGLTEHLNYYIDNSARESFLATARLYSSMAKIAKFSKYRLRGVIASSVTLTFTLSDLLSTNYVIT